MSNWRAMKHWTLAAASMVALACACGDGEVSVAEPGSEQDDSEGRPCTLVACFSDFPIQLEQPDAWQFGSYEVSVSVDGGEPETCIVELGDAPTPRGAARFCATQLFTVAYVTGGQRAMSSNRHLDQQGSLPETVAAIRTVHVERGEHVELVVTGPGGIVTQSSFTPAWGEYFSPNGFECGPNCRDAAPQTAAVERPADFNE